MAAYFGDPGIDTGPINPESVMPLIRAVRNRDLEDLQARGQIEGDLAIRQANLRRIYGLDPTPPALGAAFSATGLTPPAPGISTQLKEDISPLDKAKLGLEKSAQDIESSKVKQAGQLGSERLDIQQQQADINRQKSDQIHETKIADLQRRADEATQRMGMFYDKLQQNANDNAAHLNFLTSKSAADEARHQLELAQKDRQLQQQQDYNTARIADLNKKYNDELTTIGYKRDEQGNLVQTTVRKGKVPPAKSGAFDSSTTKAFVGKDGTKYDIPMDKVDQFQQDMPDAQEVK